MASVRLTEARLSKRPQGREELRDLGAQGLIVRGGPRGWTFSFRQPPRVGAAGRSLQRRITLGIWSPVAGLGLSLKEARQRAAALGGQQPAVSAKPGETVRSLAEDFLARRYPKNEVRRGKVRALLECHALHAIGGLAVAQVTREHCVGLVQGAQVERRVFGKGSVRRGGRAPAEMLTRVLRQLFRHAVKTGRLETLAHSPAELLEARDFGIGEAQKRDRWLNAKDLAQLFLHPEVDIGGILAGRPGKEFGLSLSVRAAIILGPHLAVRPKALVGLRWDEVDVDKASATIRGSRGAKAKHGAKPSSFVVPLSTTATAVLRSMRGTEKPSSPWVFPTASKGGHLTGDVLADAMLRLSARLELPGGAVRPHDARRSFANAATNLGVERMVVERCLQHSLGLVGDTYLGDSVEQRRREAHELVDAHWTAERTGVAAKVLPIRSKRR